MDDYQIQKWIESLSSYEMPDEAEINKDGHYARPCMHCSMRGGQKPHIMKLKIPNAALKMLSEPKKTRQNMEGVRNRPSRRGKSRGRMVVERAEADSDSNSISLSEFSYGSCTTDTKSPPDAPFGNDTPDCTVTNNVSRVPFEDEWFEGVRCFTAPKHRRPSPQLQIASLEEFPVLGLSTQKKNEQSTGPPVAQPTPFNLNDVSPETSYYPATSNCLGDSSQRTGHCLLIEHLPAAVTEEQLTAALAAFGTIKAIGLNNCTASVWFDKEDERTWVMSAFEGTNPVTGDEDHNIIYTPEGVL